MERIIMQTKFASTDQPPANRDQPPKQEKSVKGTKSSTIGFGLGAALWVTLTGCVVEHPHHHHRAYAPPPPVHVEPAVVVQEDYVYYPAYEVYYSNSRRHYIYRDGPTWVSRPAPPRVRAEVLLASPSVRLDFHDAPSRHHTTVVRQYPKHWAPPEPGPRPGPGDRK